MSSKRKTLKRAVPNRRNSNKHHPKHFAKVYWPYLPIIAVVLAGMVFGNVAPQTRVDNPATLAYATEMSVSALLSATNQQRANNGLGALTVNSLLNSSAQAKANDMVAKNYWSHNTPSGQEPWVFFDAAGYEYSKAGENLAYGFGTSGETVVGWMNSPSHRANILDTMYTEVGFGFANSSDFVSTGNETIVVAHYAKPLHASSPAPAPAPTPAPAPAPQSKPQSLPAQAEKSVEQPAETPAQAEEQIEQTGSDVAQPTGVPAERYNQPVTSDAPVPDDISSTNITRLQSITGGQAPWSALIVSIGAISIVGLWLVRHAVLVKRYALKGEHFVAHHPVFDLLVVIVAALAVYLSQASGVVL